MVTRACPNLPDSRRAMHAATSRVRHGARLIAPTAYSRRTDPIVYARPLHHRIPSRRNRADCALPVEQHCSYLAEAARLAHHAPTLAMFGLVPSRRPLTIAYCPDATVRFDAPGIACGGVSVTSGDWQRSNSGRRNDRSLAQVVIEVATELDVTPAALIARRDRSSCMRARDSAACTRRRRRLAAR